MVRSFGPVIATALMAVGAVIVFVDHSLIQVAVGGALVLWLPGYALTAALFSQSQLQGIERTLFSIGTSIAVAILTGFGLNAVGISLTAWTWGVALGGLALAAGALPIESVHDEFDWRQGVAWLGFMLREREVRWPAKIEERWIDPNVLSRFVGLLDEQDTDLRFTGLDLGGQDCLIGCATKEQFHALRKLTGLELEWLG